MAISIACVRLLARPTAQLASTSLTVVNAVGVVHTVCLTPVRGRAKKSREHATEDDTEGGHASA